MEAAMRERQANASTNCGKQFGFNTLVSLQLSPMAEKLKIDKLAKPGF
jgi:hypothetical protein